MNRDFYVQPTMGPDQAQPGSGKFLGWLGLFLVPGSVQTKNLWCRFQLQQDFGPRISGRISGPTEIQTKISSFPSKWYFFP
jgi:hypothetical protein